jgi:hypothetical protein
MPKRAFGKTTQYAASVKSKADDAVTNFLRQKYPYAGMALEERLLDRADMHERWGCSFESLKRFERAGILKPIRLGGRVRYRLSDVLRSEREGELCP